MRADGSVLVVEAGPLREAHFTGIPNVVAEICLRLLAQERLDVRFLVNDRVVDRASMARCLEERSGTGLAPSMAHGPSAASLLSDLARSGGSEKAVALYTERRPLVRRFGREGLMLYDLSMILAPECHTPGSVTFYTQDLVEQVAASDILFCISQATARDAVWLFGLPPERVRVALLGATIDDTDVERVRAFAGSGGFEPYILVLGSIEPRKNAALILKWLSSYPEVFDEYRIVFAGRQAWGATLAEQVRDWSLDGAVATGRLVYLSFVDETLKTTLLAGASALLYPSIFEGFGLPLLEAMAVGTPVLASSSTSMPEVVGPDGYYFDPYSVESLHAALRRLRGDAASGRLTAVVERAKRRAATFSYDATFRVIWEGLFAKDAGRS